MTKKSIRLSRYICRHYNPVQFKQQFYHNNLNKSIMCWIYTLSNPAVGETVLIPVKWCCNTGEVPIRLKKTMDEQTSSKKLLFSLILYKRLQ